MLTGAFLIWCAWWHAYTGNPVAAAQCVARIFEEAPCWPHSVNG